MIGLLQRVSRARVEVDHRTIAEIGPGLVVLVGIERDDTEARAERLLERLLGFRVFADRTGKMNLSLLDTGGGLLLVPQFTLPADTRKGTRPSFSAAAAPETGRMLFEFLLDRARTRYDQVTAGRFGASMQLTLTNEGPVTFWLQT